MSRYIDANKLKKSLSIPCASIILKELPSAEPERKKGEWVVYKAPDQHHCGLVECPFCGEDMVAEADEYNYCPNCGADMRGDKK